MKYFLITLIIFIALLISLNIWWSQNSKPVSKEEVFSNFLITKGSSALKIAEKLKEKGIIRSSLAFKLYVQFTGQSGKIQAGEYLFSPSYSLTRIIKEFTKGPAEVWVTIPEGLRREQVAEKFVSGLGKKGDEADSFWNGFVDFSKDKEGYLFPDTYLFPKTASAEAVVNKMFSVFNQKVDSKMRQDIKGSKYTLEEIVTIASLVERETREEEEKPIVAGILLKRLDKNWPLQVDATIQYALATTQCRGETQGCRWWPTTTIKDRQIGSAFNSYKFIGLPPAPIANPGLASIKAVIYPKTTSFWYYLHDPSGKIYYAETNDKHNENIRKYLL